MVFETNTDLTCFNLNIFRKDLDPCSILIAPIDCLEGRKLFRKNCHMDIMDILIYTIYIHIIYIYANTSLSMQNGTH